MALTLRWGQPRTLAYSQAIRKDLKMLEVDEGLLQELLSSGLCFKGAPGEEAVLCSGSQTFTVKSVETTNLLLLVHEDAQAGGEAPLAVLASQDLNLQPTPPGALRGLSTQLHKDQAAAQHAPVAASALVSSHLELVPTAPRLHQLDALLQEQRYGAGEGEDEDASDGMDAEGPGGGGGAASLGYTEAELLQRVQCSAAELREALRQRKAFCRDGRYCAVDGPFQGTLLELVLLTAVERGWPLDAVPGDDMAAALRPLGYDCRATLHCLHCYSLPPGPDASSDGGAAAMEADVGRQPWELQPGGLFALDEAAVCVHFALVLLAEAPDWELAAFEAEWRRRVPEGMTPSLGMLRGEARQYGGGGGAAGTEQPRRIKRFAAGALPADAAARFAALFAESARWEWEELEPHVRGLQGPGLTAEALLLKYARASQQRPTDPITYSAR